MWRFKGHISTKATSDERNEQCHFGSKSSADWEVTAVGSNIEAVSMVGRRRFYTCKRQEGVGRWRRESATERWM